MLVARAKLLALLFKQPNVSWQSQEQSVGSGELLVALVTSLLSQWPDEETPVCVDVDSVLSMQWMLEIVAILATGRASIKMVIIHMRQFLMIFRLTDYSKFNK